jgi:hypothetical protein
MQQSCLALEQQLLASTVRVEVRVFSVSEDDQLIAQVNSSTGHATVKNGRYLVTHNHYGIPLSHEQPGTSTRVTVFKANENSMLLHGPLSVFQVVLEEPQSLVLDFGAGMGQGMFAELGMASADFRHWQGLSLQTNMEVAQLNWDGQSAHVDWVKIEEIAMKDGIYSLRL